MSFERMRAKLVERGLLDRNHRLTQKGHEHVDRLKRELRDQARIDFPCGDAQKAIRS